MNSAPPTAQRVFPGVNAAAPTFHSCSFWALAGAIQPNPESLPILLQSDFPFASPRRAGIAHTAVGEARKGRAVTRP